MPTIVTRLIGSLLLLAALLPWAAPAAAQGLATHSYGFEDELDGTAIEDRLPGLAFTSDGAPWRFGDVRSGTYNAPYPEACPAFGGPCAYAVRGHGFAWLGASGGSGTITITGGAATGFAAAFSTSGALTITAYDPDGQELESRQVAPNIRTGRLDTVSFSAPAIGAVRIAGPANAWIMDDLQLELPADPLDGQTIVTPTRSPAEVTVVQRVTEAPATLAPGSTLTLTVIATNRGRGQATNVWITLPLDQAQVDLRDARFSRATAWVSRISPEAITIETGTLHSKGDVITATLTLAIVPQAAAGHSFGGRLGYRWLDHARGGMGRSNRLSLAVGDPAPPAVAALETDEAGATLGPRRFSAAIFAPGEPVAAWYHAPDGTVVALGRVTADSEGRAEIAVTLRGLPPGSYQLVAAGVWSALEASADFTVP